MFDDKLDKVKLFYKKHRVLPSYSEMARLFGFASKKAVFDVVHRWIEEGVLKKEGHKLAPTPQFFSIPYVGVIKAGYPILAEEYKQYYNLDEFLIRDPARSFLLRVSGDSMIDLGIFEGDFVIIEKTTQAKADEIVLAEIDNEWTLKVLRVDRKKHKTYLEAANPNYPLFFPTQELKIHGIVRAVIRKFQAWN